jgi:hypothetical protein
LFFNLIPVFRSLTFNASGCSLFDGAWKLLIDGMSHRYCGFFRALFWPRNPLWWEGEDIRPQGSNNSAYLGLGSNLPPPVRSWKPSHVAFIHAIPRALS